jgi:hypothetical protein
VDHYLILFLKFIASPIPVEYDYDLTRGFQLMKALDTRFE